VSPTYLPTINNIGHAQDISHNYKDNDPIYKNQSYKWIAKTVEKRIVFGTMPIRGILMKILMLNAVNCLRTASTWERVKTVW